MKTQSCFNCYYYSAYYKQMTSHYARQTHGVCSKHKLPKKQKEVCEEFKDREKKEALSAESRLNFLEEAIKSINIIAEIMKEKENSSP